MAGVQVKPNPKLESISVQGANVLPQVLACLLVSLSCATVLVPASIQHLCTSMASGKQLLVCLVMQLCCTQTCCRLLQAPIQLH